jgi:hypothetical protein
MSPYTWETLRPSCLTRLAIRPALIMGFGGFWASELGGGTRIATSGMRTQLSRPAEAAEAAARRLHPPATGGGTTGVAG